MKFPLLLRGPAVYLIERYSERKETVAARADLAMATIGAAPTPNA